jgi:hypothetical protein
MKMEESNPPALVRLSEGLGCSAEPMHAHDTKAATVTTAEVSVSTLSIGGRQMTLALYRQIPELDAFPPEGKPYRPLGWVRYTHPKRLSGRPTMTVKHANWAVIVADGDLYKVPVREDMSAAEFKELGLPQLFIAT